MTQAKTTTKRAVIYARVSTADQSCDRQIGELVQLAQRSEYEIVGVFKETASGARNDRPERAKILELARQRKIDVVLVSELSRWGRSLVDLVDSVELLKSKKVSLIAGKGDSFDLDNAGSKAMFQVLGVFSEYERSVIAERVKSGLEAARARGKKLGRQPGQNPSDKYARKVLAFLAQEKTIRWIADELHISTTTVQAIRRRHAEKQAAGV